MPPRRGSDDFGPSPQIALPRLTPAVKWMLIGLGVLFVLQLVTQNWLPEWIAVQLTHALLYPHLVVLRGQLWRLLTWPLIQPGGADVSASLFSAMALYFFGTDLEEQWGTRRFLLFTVLCIGLCGLIATLYGLVHSVFFTQPVFGVSSLAMAVTAAWGTRYPHRRLLFPPVSGRVLVWITLGFALLPVIMRSPSVSPAASVGAVLVGWLLAKYWDRIDDFLDRRRLKSLRARRDRVLRAIPGGGGKSSEKGRPIDKRYLN